MAGLTISEMQEKLNKLYWTDITGYSEFLMKVKNAGYKVLRNSKGIHKVEPKFSDIFGQIFNGRL